MTDWVRYDPALFLTAPRCQSVSPNLPPVQCALPASHNETDQEITHRNGALVWVEKRDGSTHTIKADQAAIRVSFTSGNATPSEEQLLRDWWRAKADIEIELTVPKAVEYGSTDLIDIGLMLGRTMRRTVTEEEAAELGVFFYLIGKVARWQSAIERGERPSDDTLLDIGVYVRMAQRIRDAGGWPGTRADPIMHSMCTTNDHDGCFDRKDT